MNNLVFLHHQYGDKYENACIDYLIRISKILGPEVNSTFVITDNKIEENFMKNRVINNFHFLASSNQYKEFSGWQAGLDYVRNDLKLINFNLVISNDTFFRHRVFDESLFEAFISGFIKCFNSSAPVACGQKDSIESNPPYLFDLDNTYISTYLWGINSHGVNIIPSFINQNIFNLFNKNNNLSSIFDLSRIKKTEYIYFIEELLYRPSNRRHKWHGFEALSEKNIDAMRLKAFSILNEHWLSSFFRSENIKLVDISVLVRRSKYLKLTYELKRKLYSIKWRLLKVINNV